MVSRSSGSRERRHRVNARTQNAECLHPVVLSSPHGSAALQPFALSHMTRHACADITGKDEAVLVSSPVIESRRWGSYILE